MTGHTHRLRIGLTKDVNGHYLGYVKKLPAVSAYAKTRSDTTRILAYRCAAYLNTSPVAHSKLTESGVYRTYGEIVKMITVHCH